MSPMSAATAPTPLQGIGSDARAATPSLRDQMIESIQAAIITGEFAPGDLITIPTLASRYQVSATPVREALLELESQGFVEAVRNRGYRVTRLGPEDLAEIVAIRRMLEVPAIRQAAALFPVEQAEEFRLLAAAIVGYALQGDLTNYLAADWRFHRALLQLAGNGRLIEIVRQLRTQTRMIGLVEIVGTDTLRASAEEHQQLVDLLEQGAADQAAELMHDHIGHVLNWWSGSPEAS